VTTKAVARAAERAADALRVAVDAPGTMTNRKAAEAIIALRRQFKHEGIPDWAGRSPEYRDIIEHLYRDVGVPSDSAGGLQANLRYHLGNALRSIAPPEDLEALGMSIQGPLGRVKATREASPRPSRRKARSVTIDPETLAGLALEAIRALRQMADEATASVEPTLRALLDETVEALRELGPAH
jgi:hypothetical protein